MKNNLLFRIWFYFRNGWSMYFAFVMAAVNTLTVTYYLAIERYPTLLALFPSFIQYAVLVVIIGVPTLVLIGYVHFKRTAGYRSEIDVTMETNPYWARIVANTEMNLQLNLRFVELLQKISLNSKMSENEIKELEDIKSNFVNLIQDRTFYNKKDIEFLKTIDPKNKSKLSEKE